MPTLRVSDAFIGGASQVSLSTRAENRFELQNYTSWTNGNHSFRAGARLRRINVDDVAPQNFRGTYTFSGNATLTSIERYRLTLDLMQQGVPASEIRLRGGGATQFSVSGGNPEARVTQTDFSPFVQDDWRLRSNLTISLGLRYEAQNNISDWTNFAPRVAFAWSPEKPSAGRRQTTVIRGGIGFFYERFNENLTLQTNRYNGTNQQQFVVTASLPNGIAVLDQFPRVPTAAELQAFSIPQTTRRVAGDLRAPYTMQGSLSLERQLPHHVTMSLAYVGARTLHVLRSRNVNAPIPGSLARPLGSAGNVFVYESSGRFNQNQFIANVNSRLSRNLNLFANYVFNSASSDTDGPNSFPINQFDTQGEYGPAASDIRHRLVVGGQINVLPWGIRLNPFITANGGRPFNITSGRDTNGDALFTERPAFANDLSRPGIKITKYGNFDPNPTGNQEIIPRNYGRGPAFFAFNLRISRTFGFG
jgi:hypothetical protein